jgi:succinate dehydrogenase/fumarate reductase cytochrome b subunit
MLTLFSAVSLLGVRQALVGGAAVDNFLHWTQQPLVKAGELGLVVLLAAHMAGGVRLLTIEFLAWHEWQKSLLAVCGRRNPRGRCCLCAKILLDLALIAAGGFLGAMVVGSAGFAFAIVVTGVWIYVFGARADCASRRGLRNDPAHCEHLAIPARNRIFAVVAVPGRRRHGRFHWESSPCSGWIRISSGTFSVAS